MKSELHELVRKPSKRPSSKRTSPTPPLGTSRTSRNPRGSHIGGQPKVRKLSPYPQSSVALVARFAIDSSTAAFFNGHPPHGNPYPKVAPDRPLAHGRDLGRYLRRGHLTVSRYQCRRGLFHLRRGPIALAHQDGAGGLAGPRIRCGKRRWKECLELVAVRHPGEAAGVETRAPV